MDIAGLVLNEQDMGLMLRNALETIIQLYTDKAHFIYELLQNAEDAQATVIKFHQMDDRLEVFHDGTPFTLTNLRSLCNIRDSDKINDLNKIGEFGVGFKSVFGICDTVRLYSMPRQSDFPSDILPAFGQEINDFTHPRNIDLEPIPEPYTTKFVFPYCVGESFSGYDTMADLKNALANRLSNLGITTLLFMRNLKSIEYEIECSDFEGSGCYMLDEKKINDLCSLVTAMGDTNGSEEEVSYLKYSKRIPAITEFNRTVDIAYPVIIEKDGTYRFVKSISPYISVYFPTETESKLSIMVQGPYRTTPNRGGIPFSDKDNIMLAELTAELLYESVLDIKSQGRLSLQFLNLLPLEKPMFAQYWLFNPLYQMAIELFENHSILPTADGDYVNSSNAKLARGQELINLFNGDLLSELINQDGNYDEDEECNYITKYAWLPAQLTEDNKELSTLYTFLRDSLGIKVIRANDLPYYLSQHATFLWDRDDEWLVQFYYYLEKVPRLVERSNAKGNLLSVPFVKTSNNSFVTPFHRNMSPNVFVPINGVIDGFQFVHPTLFERCRSFFTEVLRLNEPDRYALFKNRIRERYSSQPSSDLTDEEHKRDFDEAVRFLGNNELREDLCETVYKLDFIQCVTDKGKWYVAPRFANVFLEISNESESAQDYLVPKSDIYFVNMEVYGNTGLNRSALSLFGVKNSLIENIGDREWYYKGNALWRDIGDFRSSLTFTQIEEVLDFIKKNPTSDAAKEKSRIIMRLLLYTEKHLEGEIIKGKTRKERESAKAQIVERLTDGRRSYYSYVSSRPRWLFDKDGNLVNPAEISKYDLDTKIYGKLKPNSNIYNILGFKYTEEDAQEDFITNVENQSEHTQDLILNRLLMRYLGVPLSEIRTKMDTLETLERTMTECSGTNDGTSNYFNPDSSNWSSEFPSRPVSNLDLLRKSITRQYKSAPRVQFEARQLSVRVSKDRDRVRSYLESMYSDENNRNVCICQMCKKATSEFHSVQIEKNPNLELNQMYMLLCPNCAIHYRTFRNDQMVYAHIINRLFEADESQEEPICVSIGSKIINFTATHIAEIKEILKLNLQTGFHEEAAEIG